MIATQPTFRVGQVLTIRAVYEDSSGRRRARKGLARVSRVYEGCAVFLRFADRADDYHGETKGGIADSKGRRWGPLEGFAPDEIVIISP